MKIDIFEDSIEGIKETEFGGGFSKTVFAGKPSFFISVEQVEVGCPRNDVSFSPTKNFTSPNIFDLFYTILERRTIVKRGCGKRYCVLYNVKHMSMLGHIILSRNE